MFSHVDLRNEDSPMIVWHEVTTPQDSSYKSDLLNAIYHHAHKTCNYSALHDMDEILNHACERVMEIDL